MAFFLYEEQNSFSWMCDFIDIHLASPLCRAEFDETISHGSSRVLKSI